MMKKNDDIQPWSVQDGKLARKAPTELDSRAAEVRIKAAERSIEAAADLIALLVRGGHVFLSEKEIQAQSAKAWEETRQRIQLLDAESEVEVRKLEAQFQHTREKTERLRMVLDLIASKGETLSETYALGLSRAVEHLVRDE